MLNLYDTCEINKKRIKSTQKQQTFCKTCYKLIKTLSNIKLGLTLQRQLDFREKTTSFACLLGSLLNYIFH